MIFISERRLEPQVSEFQVSMLPEAPAFAAGVFLSNKKRNRPPRRAIRNVENFEKKNFETLRPFFTPSIPGSSILPAPYSVARLSCSSVSRLSFRRAFRRELPADLRQAIHHRRPQNRRSARSV